MPMWGTKGFFILIRKKKKEKRKFNEKLELQAFAFVLPILLKYINI